MRRHRRQLFPEQGHKERAITIYKCFCDKEYLTIGALRMHLSIKHKEFDDKMRAEINLMLVTEKDDATGHVFQRLQWPIEKRDEKAQNRQGQKQNVKGKHKQESKGKQQQEQNEKQIQERQSQQAQKHKGKQKKESKKKVNQKQKRRQAQKQERQEYIHKGKHQQRHKKKQQLKLREKQQIKQEKYNEQESNEDEFRHSRGQRRQSKKHKKEKKKKNKEKEKEKRRQKKKKKKQQQQQQQQQLQQKQKGKKTQGASESEKSENQLQMLKDRTQIVKEKTSVDGEVLLKDQAFAEEYLAEEVLAQQEALAEQDKRIQEEERQQRRVEEESKRKEREQRKIRKEKDKQLVGDSNMGKKLRSKMTLSEEGEIKKESHGGVKLEDNSYKKSHQQAKDIKTSSKKVQTVEMNATLVKPSYLPDTEALTRSLRVIAMHSQNIGKCYENIAKEYQGIVFSKHEQNMSSRNQKEALKKGLEFKMVSSKGRLTENAMNVHMSGYPWKVYAEVETGKPKDANAVPEEQQDDYLGEQLGEEWGSQSEYPSVAGDEADFQSQEQSPKN